MPPDACCNFLATVDDTAYLTALIDYIEANYNVDPKRIYLVGHSNGAVMAYRMACDHADRIAAIASLAGATFADRPRCKPTQPVSILQIHGTADATIEYDGGQIEGHTYPGTQTTVAAWAAYNGCRATPDLSSTKLDLDASINGEETSVSTFTDCRPGGAVELWTIDSGTHVPTVSSSFSSRVVDFLYAHARP